MTAYFDNRSVASSPFRIISCCLYCEAIFHMPYLDVTPHFKCLHLSYNDNRIKNMGNISTLKKAGFWSKINQQVSVKVNVSS